MKSKPMSPLNCCELYDGISRQGVSGSDYYLLWMPELTYLPRKYKKRDDDPNISYRSTPQSTEHMFAGIQIERTYV